jgi:hypothetical protein
MSSPHDRSRAAAPADVDATSEQQAPASAGKKEAPPREGVPVVIAYAADKRRIGKVEYHETGEARRLVAEGRARYAPAGD